MNLPSLLRIYFCIIHVIRIQFYHLIEISFKKKKKKREQL